MILKLGQLKLISCFTSVRISFSPNSGKTCTGSYSTHFLITWHHIPFSSQNATCTLNCQFAECYSVSSVGIQCPEVQFQELLGRKYELNQGTGGGYTLPVQIIIWWWTDWILFCELSVQSTDSIQGIDGMGCTWWVSMVLEAWQTGHSP